MVSIPDSDDAVARRNEETYVHAVYETIADHFSRTRYKPWPGISNFFASLDKGSLGIDAGCGNGKYLGLRSVLSSQPPATSVSEASVRGNIVTIGLDRSSQLIKIGKERGHEVLVGDAIDLPWRDGAFDFAISIATIHHFTTPGRRKEAVKTMLRAINPHHGKLFIQVWAVEQEDPNNPSSESSKPLLLRKARQMEKLETVHLKASDAESGKDAAGRDVFVPWKLQSKPTARAVDSSRTERRTKEKGARGKSIEAGEGEAESQADDSPAQTSEPTYQRYYHLFERGELRTLVKEAVNELRLEESVRIDEDEEWEQGNWCIQARYTDSAGNGL